MTTSTGWQLHYPVLTRPAISLFLGQDERVAIADQLRAGVLVRRIAAELGRSPATVSREIARNREPVSGQYRPFAAQQRAAGRWPRPKQRKFAADPELREFVQNQREKRWSPEQIAHPACGVPGPTGKA